MPSRAKSPSTGDRDRRDGGRDPEGGQDRATAPRPTSAPRSTRDRRDALQRLLEVVETVERPATRSRSKDARAQPGRQVGDFIAEPLPPIDFGRIAAQSAKQVIVQKVREAERDRSMTNTRTASARSSTARSSASNTATSSSISAAAKASSAATS
jgi:hypothetical protein